MPSMLIPSSPAKAYGLLLAAIRDPDPVIFLEPDRIYRLGKQEVPDNGLALPLDQCFILREGQDVTLVCWGAMTHETLLAAKQLALEGIDAEVIDIATIVFYDQLSQCVMVRAKDIQWARSGVRVRTAR